VPTAVVLELQQVNRGGIDVLNGHPPTPSVGSLPISYALWGLLHWLLFRAADRLPAAWTA
jgi:hypothetical protein